MTDKEKAIVMAHTGIAMLVDDKFDIFHQYIEEKMGRPIWTHELASKKIWAEIKEATREDFNRLCRETPSEAIPIEFIEELIGQYNDWNEDIEPLIKLIEKWRENNEIAG